CTGRKPAQARRGARSRRGGCCPAPSGGASRGGAAPRVRWPPSSRRCACAWPTARRSAPACTCPARRSGWWAGAAPRARPNTTCRTCPPGPPSRPSRN
ncbi:MAG: hypothetical protein AVDCRST_MAG04-831, partial [uncultured Acetobacteraceae bacterium]